MGSVKNGPRPKADPRKNFPQNRGWADRLKLSSHSTKEDEKTCFKKHVQTGLKPFKRSDLLIHLSRSGGWHHFREAPGEWSWPGRKASEFPKGWLESMSSMCNTIITEATQGQGCHPFHQFSKRDSMVTRLKRFCSQKRHLNEWSDQKKTVTLMRHMTNQDKSPWWKG